MICRFADQGDRKPLFISAVCRVTIAEFDVLSLSINGAFLPTPLLQALPPDFVDDAACISLRYDVYRSNLTTKVREQKCYEISGDTMRSASKLCDDSTNQHPAWSIPL
jgi:hypothetical protein